MDPDRRAKFHEFRNLLFCLPEDQLCIRLIFNFFQYIGAPTLSDRVPGDLQSGDLSRCFFISTIFFFEIKFIMRVFRRIFDKRSGVYWSDFL